MSPDLIVRLKERQAIHLIFICHISFVRLSPSVPDLPRHFYCRAALNSAVNTPSLRFGAASDHEPPPVSSQRCYRGHKRRSDNSAADAAADPLIPITPQYAGAEISRSAYDFSPEPPSHPPLLGISVREPGS